jgi:hypothetical protein
MKKILIVTTIILLAFLSACTGTSVSSTQAVANTASTAVTSDGSAVAGNSALTTDFTDAATVEQQLLAGTMQLESTANAITADQAKQLLTLWSSLNMFGPGNGRGGGGGSQPGNGDAQSTPQAPAGGAQSTPQAPAANVDIESVLSQIEAVLTPVQIQAIAAIQLTNASIQTYITDNNLSMQPGNGGDQPGGQQPQGTPPADAGNGLQPQGTQTTPVNGQAPDMTTNILLNAVIQLLQQKTGAIAQAE